MGVDEPAQAVRPAVEPLGGRISDVISALVWLALHIACRNDSRAARALGLAAASILLVFAILTGFTIGTFVLPGAVALTVAAALTPLAAPAHTCARKG